jgi:hypothetical protein
MRCARPAFLIRSECDAVASPNQGEGEGEGLFKATARREDSTPHLSPLPLSKGRGVTLKFNTVRPQHAMAWRRQTPESISQSASRTRFTDALTD